MFLLVRLEGGLQDPTRPAPLLPGVKLLLDVLRGTLPAHRPGRGFPVGKFHHEMVPPDRMGNAGRFHRHLRRSQSFYTGRNESVSSSSSSSSSSSFPFLIINGVLRKADCDPLSYITGCIGLSFPMASDSLQHRERPVIIDYSFAVGSFSRTRQLDWRQRTFEGR